MKTATYLRLSLLIPFVVWGICLLVFAVTNLAPETTNGPVVNSLLILFIFYVFGIIGWFLPYLLLALLLLILSVRVRAQTLIPVFALSPIAMAVFIIVFVTAALASSQGTDTFSPDLAGSTQEFLGSPVWFGIITLAWGYLCVAIGFGIYRLLQKLHLIREAEIPTSPVTPETA